MEHKQIKIMSLNLWRYYGNWQERKQNIISHIQEEKPDMVFFQECFDDGRHNTNENQAEELNKILKFDQIFYSVAEMLKQEQKKDLNVSVFDGLGCISNIKIKNVQNIRLEKHEEDRHFRIIQKITAQLEDSEIIFYHTHFSNRDDWALLHLKETLKLAEAENSQPIILGDLNIRIIKDVVETTKEKYTNSWSEKNYISFPQKDETLDYVLIPKQWKFKEINCSKDGLSDHRPLTTVIEFNQ